METELLNIFDRNHNHMGVATRADIHEKGHWHETFHCWLVKNEEDVTYVYFQLRSDRKKDYPSQLDITAAGHLLANETVVDGIREIKEEIGIDLSFEELESLGILECCNTKPGFIDNELAHVFLYRFQGNFSHFELQEEEVSGMFRAKFEDFYQFCMGEREEIDMEGFQQNNKQSIMKRSFAKEKFVPHQQEFYQAVAEKIKEHLL